MITTTEERRRRRVAASAAAVILLGCYLGGIVLLAAAARPDVSLAGPLAGYADPTNPWPIAVQVVLGGSAFLAYWWPRRTEMRSFSLLVTASLAVTTISLGLASYWGCSTGQTPFWTPLTWSLNLIVGGVNSECGHPLALQTARLFGPLLLLITALGVLAALFRSQRDRLTVRFARRLVVAVGLTTESLGILRRLAADRPPGTVLAVLTETGDAALVRAVRAFGGRVVTVSGTPDPRGLEVLLTAGGRLKVTTAYLLTADTTANLRWVESLRQLAASCQRGSSGLAPRLLVRIDDPWQAEYWRRGNAYRPGPTGVTWLCDALSRYETTAALLVDRLRQGAHDRVALIGTSPLALAVCTELAQREREDALLDSGSAALSRLVLVGPQAGRVAAMHRLRQARFGNRSDPLEIDDGDDLVGSLDRQLAGARRPAVVLADESASSGDGSELAVTHRRWTVFARSATTRGVAVEPVLEGLLPFGLTIELPPDWPLDSWERAARVAHEQYRRQVPPGSTPAARPWNALDHFLKESNVRLITTTLGSVERLGRSWLPSAALDRAEDPARPPASGVPLTEAELLQIAEVEHESWRRHLADNGWRWGWSRDQARRLHPAIRPWAELNANDRARTEANVAGAVETLAALGYRSSAPADPDPDWCRYSRSGVVTAVRTDAPWTWRSSSGALLRARAGDWRVSDGDQIWSVAGEIFRDTYRHVVEDRWARVGEVQARPAAAGEVITSLEGDQVAGAGDWVLRGRAGEEWLVSSAHLSLHYRRLDAPGPDGAAVVGDPAAAGRGSDATTPAF